MDSKFFRFTVIAVLMVLTGLAVQPSVTRFLLSETAPRPVTARGVQPYAREAARSLAFNRGMPLVRHSRDTAKLLEQPAPTRSR